MCAKKFSEFRKLEYQVIMNKPDTKKLLSQINSGRNHPINEYAWINYESQVQPF